jgi:hypothetical protein
VTLPDVSRFGGALVNDKLGGRAKADEKRDSNEEAKKFFHDLSALSQDYKFRPN